MASDRPSPAGRGLNDQESARHSDQLSGQATRDIADVPAVEVITATAVHLMSAAAVKVGLAQDAAPPPDGARNPTPVLAALVTGAAREIASQHSRPLRDGLRSLQLA